MRLATVSPWGQRIYVCRPAANSSPEAPAAGKVEDGRHPGNRHASRLLMSGKKITYFIENAPDWAFIKGERGIGNGAYDTKFYNHSRQVIMVVPDGVAKVALWYPTGSIANRPRHPAAPGSKPVIATVHNNIAAFIAPAQIRSPPP